MKKLIAMILAVVCVIGLSGCDNAKQPEEITYNFIGEHECFRISNGSITLKQPFSDEKQGFYGGELTITQPDIFENVTSYSTSFYTLHENGERNQFQSSVVTNPTGISVPVEEQLGSISTTGSMIGDLEQGLWFELKTTDMNGAENAYQIELTLAK